MQRLKKNIYIYIFKEVELINQRKKFSDLSGFLLRVEKKENVLISRQFLYQPQIIFIVILKCHSRDHHREKFERLILS